MNFDTTIAFLTQKKSNSTNESEIQTCQRFLVILKDLDSKNLSMDKIESIEREIKILGLEAKAKNEATYLQQRLRDFERYLQRNFKFRPVNYHSSFGIILGLSFGIAIGLSIGSLFEGLLGLVISVTIITTIGGFTGHFLGNKKDLQFEKSGRLYNNKLP